jgi:hypothetical protein
MRCCSIYFLCKRVGIFSKPQKELHHETIRYGACAHVRVINLDPRGRYADWWQVRATAAANYVEHRQHIEHSA